MAVMPELKVNVSISVNQVTPELLAQQQFMMQVPNGDWESAAEHIKQVWISAANETLAALAALGKRRQEKEFYIVSIKYSRGGEIKLWRPNACGYTSVLEYAGIYTADQIAKQPGYYDNGWSQIAVPREDIERLALRVVGNSDVRDFVLLARQRGLKDGTPINGFDQNPDGVRCEAIHTNGESCTRVDGHGKNNLSTLGLFHITPSDFVWYTEGLPTEKEKTA
jgi:hypothetical protein